MAVTSIVGAASAAGLVAAADRFVALHRVFESPRIAVALPREQSVLAAKATRKLQHQESATHEQQDDQRKQNEWPGGENDLHDERLSGAPVMINQQTIPGADRATVRLIAKGEDPMAGPFGLERFVEGRMIDESVAAAVAH